MKIRLKGNSLRLRIPRSEVATLITRGRLEETIWLGENETARQTWALETADNDSASLRFAPPEIVVSFPTSEVERWASGDEVGLYANVDLGTRGSLELLVEKDFACMHGSDAENADAFPNPHATVPSS